MTKSISAYVAIPKSRKSLRFGDLELVVPSKKDFTSEALRAGELKVYYNPKIERIVKLKVTIEED